MKKFRLIICLISTLFAASLCVAHEAELMPLMEKKLADLPGHQVTMLRVSYPAGGYSAPHRHATAHTFVYVLKGTLEMGVTGSPAVTLKPGDTFYEAPDDVHNISRNASADEPAEFLVFFLHPEGIPLVTPAEDH